MTHQQFKKKKMQGKKSEEVQAYIDDAPLFAKPILNRIRKAFHFGCPELEETMKWNAPHFEYKGILGSMSAHKEHVTMAFWKGQLMEDPEGVFNVVGQTQMSAIKFHALKDMPPQQVLIAYVEEAAEMNARGVKAKKKTSKVKEKLTIPDDLLDALSENEEARETFDDFSYSNKKEYVEWIEEAKKVATRRERIQTAVEWMAEGKPRNWKYQKKAKSKSAEESAKKKTKKKAATKSGSKKKKAATKKKTATKKTSKVKSAKKKRTAKKSAKKKSAK